MKNEFEKDLELAETNLSQSDSELQETINGIIPQNTDEDNAMYDPFGGIDEEIEADNEDADVMQDELSDYQQCFLNTEIRLEKGNTYKAQPTGIEITNSGYTNYFNFKYNVSVNGKTKEVKDTIFFNHNKSCREYSIMRLKELANQFDFSLSIQDCVSLETMAKAFNRIKGIWVELKYVPRYDKASDKEYDNFEIVKVLGKDCDLGGNL